MPGAELALLALAAALGAPAAPATAAAPPQAAPARACSLGLAADRATLRANDPRAVRLTVTSPAEPRLVVSDGVVEGLRPDGPGTWTATWTAPAAGIPRVALLAALAGDDCGLLAVPLFGGGDAVVRTRPGAEVEVRIGERLFGPATAGRDGVALIPVEVPPGVDSVFHGPRRISLDIPPVSHAFVAAWAPAAPADREQVVALLVAAAAVDGGPRLGPPPALSASAGTLGVPEPAGPGAWRVAWRLPPGPVAPVEARAVLPGEPAAGLTLPRPAGPPAAGELRLERAVASPDDGPIPVSLTLRDAADHPAGGLVELTADAGQVAPAAPAGPGRYATTWTPPERLEGRSEATLTARAGAFETRARIPLRPGAPARLALSAEADEVTADGRQELRVLAEVADRGGNPLSQPPTSLSAAAGELGAPRPDGPGRHRLTYRPRAATAWSSDELVAGLPPLTARLPVRLRPPTSRLTVGAWAGAGLQGGSWLGLQAGVEVAAWRWLAGQELGLGLGAAFSRFRDRSTAEGGTPLDVTGELRTTTCLAVAGWRRSAGRALAAGVELGAGAGRVESLVGTGGPLRSEARWTPALGAGAWLGLPAWRGRAVLALRASWLAAPKLATLQGTVAPLSLTLGYELDVP